MSANEHLEKWYALERSLSHIVRSSQVDNAYLTRGTIIVGNKTIYELQCEVVNKSTDTIFTTLSQAHPEEVRIVTVIVSRVGGKVKRVFQSVEG